jgi:serine/threonine protein kinase
MTAVRGQFLIGRQLGGCVLEQLIGCGGYSAVFLAQQSHPERKVAVKVFLPHAHIDAQMQHDFYQRFLLEAEAVSQLHHAHILPIYSYGEQDSLSYIVMPYMQGGTLLEHIAKYSPLSLEEARCYVQQIASALDYAHKHGCVHCDVKPANILLNGQGQVMLSDFGIACIAQREDVTEQVTARPKGVLLGTPHYISPEQALGQPLDGRSDIYSLGITLFYLLAKQLPFQADSTIALALLHVYQPPPSLALMRADVSPTVDRVIHKALAKEPALRFQTAGEFSAAFSQALASHEPASAATLNKLHPLLGNELEPLLLAAESIVLIKPLARHLPTLSHIMAIASIALIIVSATAFTIGIMTSHLLKDAALLRIQTSISRSTGEASIEALLDHDNWPISSTTFFDTHNRQLYHMVNQSQQGAIVALYANHKFNNFRLTITTLEIHKFNDTPDYYGVVFRSTVDLSHYYLFEISLSDGGQYLLSRYDDEGHKGGLWQPLAHGVVPLLTASNTIRIEAHGNTFACFINNKPVVASVTDQAALFSGELGLYVEEQGAEVAFSHFSIQPF